MKPKSVALVMVTIVALACLGYLMIIPFRPFEFEQSRSSVRLPSIAELHMYLATKAIVATVNAGMLVLLLWIYIGVYRKTRADFSIGLIIFATVLLLHSVMSGPLILMLSMQLRVFGLSAVTALLELLTTAAIAVLLYLSLK